MNRLLLDVPSDRHVAGRQTTKLRNKVMSAGLKALQTDKILRGEVLEYNEIDYLDDLQTKKIEALMPEVAAYVRSLR